MSYNHWLDQVSSRKKNYRDKNKPCDDINDLQLNVQNKRVCFCSALGQLNKVEKMRSPIRRQKLSSRPIRYKQRASVT